MFRQFNANPKGARKDDCVVRALSVVLKLSWEKIYLDLAIMGYILCNMPSTMEVWGEYLTEKGFSRFAIPNQCPNCYTIRDFCREHPFGKYILVTGSHVVAVVDGDYYDSWGSGDEVPVMFWERR